MLIRVSTLRLVRRLGFAFFALTRCASPAFAGWSANPVTVTSTFASIPLVEGCADGTYGAFVAWQEGSPTGVVRAQHLLSNGDLDPAWPDAGTVACNIVTARSELFALPDRIGGAYLFWKEGNSLFVTRLAPDGAVAAGWPERGRSLGAVHPDSPRPNIIEDGSNGFYAVWTSSLGSLAAARLGPEKRLAERRAVDRRGQLPLRDDVLAGGRARARRWHLRSVGFLEYGRPFAERLAPQAARAVGRQRERLVR